MRISLLLLLLLLLLCLILTVTVSVLASNPSDPFNQKRSDTPKEIKTGVSQDSVQISNGNQKIDSKYKVLNIARGGAESLMAVYPSLCKVANITGMVTGSLCILLEQYNDDKNDFAHTYSGFRDRAIVSGALVALTTLNGASAIVDPKEDRAASVALGVINAVIGTFCLFLASCSVPSSSCTDTKKLLSFAYYLTEGCIKILNVPNQLFIGLKRSKIKSPARAD
jgi:hypothetical protein